MGLLGNLMGKGNRFSDSMKYVDDYKVELVRNERGRLRKKTTYIGLWFCMREDGRGTRARLIASTALGVCAAADLVGLLMLDHAGSGWLPVSLPKVAALFPMLYLLMGLLSLPFGGKPMPRDRYMHSFIRSLRSSVALLALEGVSLLLGAVYRLLYRDWLFLSGDWQYLVLCAMSFASLGAILRLLSGIGIKELPNAACAKKEAASDPEKTANNI